jgi:hypothetical protein
LNQINQDRVDALFDCFRQSMGVRAAARYVGVARNTASHYLKQFEANKSLSVSCLCGKPRHRGWCKAQENAERTEAFCGCGRSLRHRGWCSIRVGRSIERQRLIRRWHPDAVFDDGVRSQATSPPSCESAKLSVTPIFVTMSPAIPREKQQLREMLAQAVANTAAL